MSGETGTLRAITVRQPWASLIMLRWKRVETRGYQTKHRGLVAIHAGAHLPCRVGQTFTVGAFEVERDQSGLLLRGESLSWPYRLPLGAIIGTADLHNVRPVEDIEPDPYGDYSPGRYGWDLRDVKRCSPITYPGKLSMWTVPAVIALRLGGDLS